ncbi:MAG TPA: efflux RND transporter periplasmic adaptor subunit [archaeon]|nr:efflux RND transporter periplasmic adaptor subunit [archaeon]
MKPRFINKLRKEYVSKPVFLFLLPLFCLSLGGCSNGEDRFFASGTFEAVEVDVGCLLTGRLLSLEKREGDLVKKDELLALIDCEKLQIERELVSIQLEETDLELDLFRKKVAAGRINLKNNQKSLQRIEALHKEKSATGQQLDDLSTAVELNKTSLDASLKELEKPVIQRRELEARIKLLDRNIADSRVYSPLDGQVLARFAEPGEVVTVGRSLLRVADLSLLEIRVYLPASLLGRIRLGQDVALRADGDPEREIAGRVAWISPVAEFTPKNVQTPEARAELVYAVKVEVPNPDGMLKVGMPADVYFK